MVRKDFKKEETDYLEKYKSKLQMKYHTPVRMAIIKSLPEIP